MAQWQPTLEGMGLNKAQQIVLRDCSDILHHAQKALLSLAGCHLLISGGAGFLGYYFYHSILHFNRHHDAKIKLSLIDSCLFGKPRWLNKIPDSNIRFLKHDICDELPQDLRSAEYIIHAASIASPIHYRQNPLATLRANVYGLDTLLQKQCFERLLFFSSSEVYGEPLILPTPENHPGLVSCTGPRACYDEAKRFAETLCMTYFQQYQKPIVIIRPFNNYGPGMRFEDGRIPSDVAKAIFLNQDIRLYSDGKTTRSFCYITDAIAAYFNALVFAKPGQAYNIGNPQEHISVYDFANKSKAIAKSLFAYDKDIIFEVSKDKYYLTDCPSKRQPCVNKAEQAFHFKPQINLEQGLEKFLNWFKYYYER